MDGVESSIEDVNEVTKQATVSISAEVVKDRYNTALNEAGKGAQLKGFRQGKVPRDLLEKVHGKRVQLEVANRLISDSLSELIKGIEEHVIGTPEVELSSFEPGEAIKFTANISLFPNPEIAGYDEFKVAVPKRETADKDVEEMVDRVRQSKATHQKLESRTVVEKTDVIDAMLQVAEPDQDFSAEEPLVIGLGEGRLPQEMEEEIVGMEVGATKVIEVPIPEDHPNEEMRGKIVKYKVVLNSISEKTLPELDDEFVKSLGFEGIETVLELKLDFRKRLEDENKKISSNEIRETLLEELLSKNEFLIPDVLLDDEIRGLVVKDGLIDTSKMKESAFPVDPWRDTYREAAAKRVMMAICIDRIAEKEDLKATEDDISAYISEMSEANGIPEDNIRQFLLSEERAVNTFMEVTRTKVLEFLEKRAKVDYTEAKEEAEKKPKKTAKKTSKKSSKKSTKKVEKEKTEEDPAKTEGEN